MSGFGRDEMNLLVGGESEGLGTAGTALTSSRSFASQQAQKSARPKEVDIASMSTAQTAAFLQRKQQQQQQKNNVGRYRTTRTLAHHQLLEEEMQQQLAQDKPKDHHGDHLGRESSDESNEEDKDDDVAFSRKRVSSNKASRRVIEPQILKRKHHEEAQHSQRRRPPSSSNSDSEGHRRQRRRRESSSGARTVQTTLTVSSSDSDSSEDVRRQRVLRNRRQRMDENKQPEEKLPIDKEHTYQKNATHTIERHSEASPNSSLRDAKGERGTVPLLKHKQDSSSDDPTSSSGSDEESSEDASSSEDDDQAAIAKPLFVPRHRRHQILKEEQEEVVMQQSQLKKTQDEGKRAMESRALVAQVVSLAKSTDVNPADSDSEEAQAQRMLDDDDDNDTERERDAWEIRELERLLNEIDRLQKAEAEMAEYRRRQQLTDEQAMHEDESAGLYKKPGQQLQRGGQRFFHRGAYYMDHEEWTEDDIRHKAGDYAQQATGSDKIDRRALPKVMQVKKFGFANQSKYQGLAKEDTTDKTLQSVPLVHRSKKSSSRSS